MIQFFGFFWFLSTIYTHEMLLNIMFTSKLGVERYMISFQVSVWQWFLGGREAFIKLGCGVSPVSINKVFQNRKLFTFIVLQIKSSNCFMGSSIRKGFKSKALLDKVSANWLWWPVSESRKTLWRKEAASNGVCIIFFK